MLPSALRMIAGLHCQSVEFPIAFSFIVLSGARRRRSAKHWGFTFETCSHRARRSNVSRNNEERRDYARRRFWQRSRLARNATAETYLRSRAIRIPVSPAIRFIPLLFHREYGWPFPALVAGLQDAEGAFAAVSITWLCADGTQRTAAGD
jgi:hypothetical protein